jgi:ribosomal protein S18 acetylase RimI-like enzyme
VEDIQKAIDYVFDRGGNITVQYLDNEIVGAVVINQTGMSGYIPENILVYIAIDNKYRGKGLGKQLMQKAIESCKGDIALHVEKDNPARFLYEKLGFTNPYLEMRLKRK